jgi:phosphate-selective porin OprO/OprP
MERKEMDAAVGTLLRLTAVCVVFAVYGFAEGMEFRFKDHPEVRVGGWLELDFHGGIQTDFREGAVRAERARVSMNGRVFRDWEFQLEHDVRPGHSKWVDTYLNFRRVRGAELRLGHFKVPFSADRLTSITELDFVYRSRIADVLAPGRDTGLLLHGEVGGKIAGYQLGVFRHGGDNSWANGGKAVASRLTVSPFRVIAADRSPESMEFGAGFVRSTRPEGISSYSGESINGNRFFEPVFVSGSTRRLGTDWKWVTGPFSIRSEWNEVREERLQQSVRMTDLPDLLIRGWYLSGTWLLTGEAKRSDVKPRSRVGAIELAARTEQIGFRSATDDGTEYRGSRVAKIGHVTNAVTSVGVNWYVNRFVKVQFNRIRERVHDSIQTPEQFRRGLWSEVFRVQLAM